MPSDLIDSIKIISFLDSLYFLFFLIFFKKLFKSFSILDFAKSPLK